MKKLLSILSMVLLIAASCVNEEEPDRSLVEGDELPQFEVETLTGRRINTSSFACKKGYIIFFSTTCGDCRRELPGFESLYRSLMASDEASGIEFICISREESVEAVSAYWREHDLTMPVAAVADRSVYSLFAASGIPRLYITDGTRITEVRVY